MNLTDYNEIQELLHRHGFRFSKSMGQNFLTASWVPADIADSAQLDSDTAVLEIGPGVGCLTEQLAARAGKVLSVELDRSLEGVLRETMAACDNVEILFGDILKQDIPALVREHFGGMRAVVCANLPYNVTSLFVQWYTRPELLFDVPPHCFHPQPKVTSSVIRLTRRMEKPFAVSDEQLLFQIIRAAFNQRRKTLANALASGLGCERALIEQALENCGFDIRIRGEALDLGSFVALTDELAKRL